MKFLLGCEKECEINQEGNIRIYICGLLTEQVWSKKELLYGIFSCRTQWVIPSGQDSDVWPSPVALSLPYPFTELVLY